jgi:lysophospholipase L1-like esterase
MHAQPIGVLEGGMIMNKKLIAAVAPLMLCSMLGFVAPTHAAALLRASLQPTSGPVGLSPLIKSVDPCPAPPAGQVAYAVVQRAIGSEIGAVPLDASGNWHFAAIWPLPTNTSQTFQATCRYGSPTSSISQLTTFASYRPVTYKVSGNSQPSLTITPTAMSKPGVVHLTAQVPCPAGREGLSIATWPTGTTVPNQMFISDARGYWRADVDLAPYAKQLRAGPVHFSAICHNATNGNDTTAPWLQYAVGKMKLAGPGLLPRTYVALGDSFSSGEGNPNFDSNTNQKNDKCHRSPMAWPRVLANAVPYDILHLACSGAVINNLTTGQYVERPQLDRLADLAETKHIDLVTVTIGGNDIGFVDLLTSCRFNPDCLAKLPSAMTKVDQTAARVLGQVLPAIEHAAPGARVVLVGYPRLFPVRAADNVNCGWLADGRETEWT